MSVVHASVELLEAMRGNWDPWTAGDFQTKGCSACGAPYNAKQVWASYANPTERVEDKRLVTCPDCIALYPPEIRVRMDHVESQRSNSPCCGVEGVRNTAANTDGWNHRAKPTDTHVCPACGKGWRYL